MIALIDADIVAYQAASSVERAVCWDEEEGLWTIHAYENEAEAKFDDMLGSILEKSGATNAILCFSGKNNWRKTVLPTYKHNRVGVRKPILLAHLKSYAEKNYVVYVEDTLEGDDLLGLYSNPNTIICSIDKDLKTIPGKHYNFGKDEFYDVSEEEADYNHLFQTLTGDATDGYPGCPGCGPKTAEKILAKSCGWEAVQTAYNKQGLSEEEALTQARVARILRPGEFDFDTNTVKLWSPNE